MRVQISVKCRYVSYPMVETTSVSEAFWVKLMHLGSVVPDVLREAAGGLEPALLGGIRGRASSGGGSAATAGTLSPVRLMQSSGSASDEVESITVRLANLELTIIARVVGPTEPAEPSIVEIEPRVAVLGIQRNFWTLSTSRWSWKNKVWTPLHLEVWHSSTYLFWLLQ